MDSYGVTFAIIVLGMLFIGTGFTKRDTPFGLFIMWVGVICMLAIISYRIYIATHY
ncbi:TPA: hypothetical protein L4F69_004109 [Pseudomonas aeruginosa]|nr:hypothetical protein [Pseudomonas aeruginosa]HBO2609848.1 hypothetical protein [Pseudomonas aeruginosa]HEP8379234.1 hypothetical protein [Pseudomonas aeruginosa]HEP8614154.1 hypothetical protein [Pseudomonas aeruginosa]HEP8647293.1 hypothetical protein [Pseudomonas aeruginosa]